MVELAYEDVGMGPAVVLVHGHPFDRSMWQPQFEALGGGFRLIAPDLRGYGQSPATSDVVLMAELADDVWQLLEQLGTDDVAVVGLSMGGLVAMEMAIAQPARLWALGLVATTAEPITEDERRARRELADQAEARGMEPLIDAMAPRLFGDAANEETVAQVLEMMRRNNPRGAAAALRGRANRPDYRANLATLRMPILVCTGTQDSWSTETVTNELLSSLHSPDFVSLPNAGHLPNLETSDRFNTELSTFLTAASRGR